MLSIRWKINSQSWQPYCIQMTNTLKKSFTMSKTNKQKEQQQQPKKTP